MSADSGGIRQHLASNLPAETRPPFAVLFVDPDMQRAESLAQALRDTCAVATVTSAQAAVSAIALRMPDLVVTELDLPDMSGVDFLAHLRTNQSTGHVLLMVVSARAGVRDKIAALRAGADDYLVRPVDPVSFALHVQLLSRFRRQFHR